MGSCYSPADNTKTDTVCGTRQNWRWSTIVEPLWGSCYCSLALTEGLYAELNTVECGVDFGTSCDFLQHIQQKREDWTLNKTHSGRWRTILESLKGSCDCSPDYLTLLHFCLSNQQSWTYRILLTQCYIPVHSVDIRTKCVVCKS